MFLPNVSPFNSIMGDFDCFSELNLVNFTDDISSLWNSSEYLDSNCNMSLDSIGEFYSNENLSSSSQSSSSSAAAAVYSNPTYYSANYRIIGTIFQGLIFVVGVLGNGMVVLVVKRTSSMQSPTNWYLVSLAVADFVGLWACIPNEIIGYYVLGDEWLWGETGCGIFVFLQYLGVNASALSITAFTIERYIAICHPMKAQMVCTVHRAKRIITGVWTFAIVYCSPWLLLTKTVPLYYKGFVNKERCTFALERHHYLGYFFADLIVFYVVPLVLSCVLYGLISRILMESGNLQLECSASTRNVPSSRCNGHRVESRPRNSAAARVQVIKMLVLVVVLFAALWMPYRVFLVYNSLASKQYMEPWFLMFSKTMVYINSAINPILYNALSLKFRKAFRRILLCGSSESSSSLNESSLVTVRFRSTLITSSVATKSAKLQDIPPSSVL